jgi:hypothetical protein
MGTKLVTKMLSALLLTAAACGNVSATTATAATELQAGGGAGAPCNDFDRCAPGFECTRGPAEGVCKAIDHASARTRLIENAVRMSEVIDRGGHVLVSRPVSELLNKADEVRGSESRTELLSAVLGDSKHDDEGIEIFVPTNQLELLDLAQTLAE